MRWKDEHELSVPKDMEGGSSEIFHVITPAFAWQDQRKTMRNLSQDKLVTWSRFSPVLLLYKPSSFQSF